MDMVLGLNLVVSHLQAVEKLVNPTVEWPCCSFLVTKDLILWQNAGNIRQIFHFQSFPKPLAAYMQISEQALILQG